MMLRYPLCIVASLVLASSALAQMPAKTESNVQSCSPTPAVAAQNYPGARNIPPMNDLTQYSGKAVAAKGQRVLIQGRIRDTRCVPIQDAIVELWQLDPFGKWMLATRADRASPNATFSGAGRTYTDNNGNFSFITLFPAGAKNAAPRLHLRILAPDMKPFTTQLYFADDVRNGQDAGYKRLSAKAREQLTLRMAPLQEQGAGLLGEVEIILPGKARYRTY